MSAPSSPKLPSAGGAPPLHRLLAGAADAVQAVREGQSLTEWLARCPADLRPGVQALSFTVLRRLGAAQVVRAALAPKNPPPRVDALLVTALALLWPGETAYADHTLVDQAVHAVRQRAPNSAGFVNAVLRRFLRGREALVAAAEADPVARFNHPRWWQDRLHADWPAEWQGLLQANQQKPPMTLRVNPAHDDLEGYLARLREAGIPAHPAGTLFPQAVVLDEPRPVQALPGFDKGHASVQDASPQQQGGIPSLARIQAELLEALWPLLKPGGRLLYATCSVFKAEGRDQIDAFLQRHGDARSRQFDQGAGHLLPLADNGPQDSASGAAAVTDGFYYALLQKT